MLFEENDLEDENSMLFYHLSILFIFIYQTLHWVNKSDVLNKMFMHLNRPIFCLYMMCTIFFVDFSIAELLLIFNFNS